MRKSDLSMVSNNVFWMLVHDFWRGVNLTACPVSSEGSSGGSPLAHHISTAAIYLLWGTLALGFATATVVKFNRCATSFACAPDLKSPPPPSHVQRVLV